MSIVTHWEGCWKQRDHHRCALARIAALEEQLRAVLEKWARAVLEGEVTALEAALAVLRDVRSKATVRVHVVDGTGAFYDDIPKGWLDDKIKELEGK